MDHPPSSLHDAHEPQHDAYETFSGGARLSNRHCPLSSLGREQGCQMRFLGKSNPITPRAGQVSGVAPVEWPGGLSRAALQARGLRQARCQPMEPPQPERYFLLRFLPLQGSNAGLEEEPCGPALAEAKVGRSGVSTFICLDAGAG